MIRDSCEQDAAGAAAAAAAGLGKIDEHPLPPYQTTVVTEAFEAEVAAAAAGREEACVDQKQLADRMTVAGRNELLWLHHSHVLLWIPL